MPEPEKTVQIIALGGTIDKQYSPKTATLVVDSSFFVEISKALRLQLTWSVEELTRKDSLDLNDEDRAMLCSAVDRAPTNHLVITHGTDTIIETALYLTQQLDIPARGKTVVLTGSFVPGRFAGHEAAFNLGFAVAMSLALPPGAFIAIGGCIYDPAAVTKDLDRQCFVPTIDQPTPHESER